VTHFASTAVPLDSLVAIISHSNRRLTACDTGSAGSTRGARSSRICTRLSLRTCEQHTTWQCDNDNGPSWQLSTTLLTPVSTKITALSTNLETLNLSKLSRTYKQIQELVFALLFEQVYLANVNVTAFMSLNSVFYICIFCSFLLWFSLFASIVCVISFNPAC